MTYPQIPKENEKLQIEELDSLDERQDWSTLIESHRQEKDGRQIQKKSIHRDFKIWDLVLWRVDIKKNNTSQGKLALCGEEPYKVKIEQKLEKKKSIKPMEKP